MIDSVTRLKKTKEKLGVLKSIRESQLYYGAGVVFTLNVGADTCKPHTLCGLEICDVPALDGILDNMIAGIESSLETQTTYLRRDVKEATQLLSDIDNG